MTNRKTQLKKRLRGPHERMAGNYGDWHTIGTGVLPSRTIKLKPSGLPILNKMAGNYGDWRNPTRYGSPAQAAIASKPSKPTKKPGVLPILKR